MKISLEVSEKNEGTDAPWWILVDPGMIHQMMEGVAEHGEVPSEDRIRDAIAFSIVGPFFSREAGQEYLKRRHYEYSKNAIIWCSSGYWSGQYKRAIQEARQ